jgi:hypothetical protein
MIKRKSSRRRINIRISRARTIVIGSLSGGTSKEAHARSHRHREETAVPPDRPTDRPTENKKTQAAKQTLHPPGRRCAPRNIICKMEFYPPPPPPPICITHHSNRLDSTRLDSMHLYFIFFRKRNDEISGSTDELCTPPPPPRRPFQPPPPQKQKIDAKNTPHHRHSEKCGKKR